MHRTLPYIFLGMLLLGTARLARATELNVNTGNNVQRTSVTTQNGTVSIDQFLQTSPAVAVRGESVLEEGQRLMNTRREEMRARNAEWRENLRERLADIKDERKRKTAEEIAEMLNTINKRYTTMLTRVLSKFENILNRIEARAAELKAQGTNTTDVEAKIATARTAVASARTAVENQAAKQYIIPDSTDDTLKENVRQVRAQLRADLKIARDAVKAAHAAVKEAGNALAALLGDD